MAQSPLRLFRLWCGLKRYTNWLADERDIWKAALKHKLAFEDRRGVASLGPLTWIEIGERARPRARTVTIGRRG